jgi:uncharacterized protein (DUF1501 family)
MKVKYLYTRREFLRSTSIIALGAVIPRFLTQLAAAAEGAGAARNPAERILVVIQLGGGNDGLNTVVPYADDAYYRVRPTLGLKPNEVIRVDDHIGFHPSLKALKELYDQGKVTIIEGVGYPNPNRSHFRSMEIWHTATDSNLVSATGWIGRYLDAQCPKGCDPTIALAVGDQRPQAFFGRRSLGVAVADPNRFAWPAGPDGANVEVFRKLNAPDLGARNSNLDFIRHVMADAVLSADKVQEVARRYKGGIDYPNDPFAANLRTVAAMIAGGLPARVYFVSLSGFDTHANQLNTQARLLQQFANGVAAFQADLEKQGNADRVVTMVFSEFGRRVQENANGGTDHGTAEPMFVIGKNIRAGLNGKRPSLTNLDGNGDLVFTTDFRSVYATLLERWLAADSATILGRKFPTLSIFG